MVSGESRWLLVVLRGEGGDFVFVDWQLHTNQPFLIGSWTNCKNEEGDMHDYMKERKKARNAIFVVVESE